MRIGVVGTGYVGLVVGACLAENGNTVTCVDNDARKVAALKAGEIPIYEPGLEEMLPRNISEDRLRFTTDLPAAVRDSEILFVAVGTPQDEDGSADLSHVLAVARAIADAMNDFKIVVLKSTVPVGTAARVRAAIAERTKRPFAVVSNPEFLKEGAALDDFMKPDRVVIGTDSERAKGIMLDLYAPFVRTNKPILAMDIRSAELTKYAANAMLATRISFMNEMAHLCELLGANVEHVRKGIGTDSRIGFPFLFPGPGYGGSCFPKDLQALIATGRQQGLDLKILGAVEAVNAAQKRRLGEKVVDRLGSSLRGRNVAVWGLAFKPNTDDMREAPSLVLIEDLLARGATVHATDPEALENAERILGHRPGLHFHTRSYDTLNEADALVLVTEWNEYRRPNFQLIRQRMRTPIIIDGRNIYPRATLESLGFTYDGIGL